jgi:hypothetical protein
MNVSDVLFLTSNFRRVANVFFLVGDSPVPEFYVPTFRNTLSHLHISCEYYVGDSPKRKTVNTRTMKMEQSVPKRRHIKCRRRGITKKKEYHMWQTLCECNTRLQLKWGLHKVNRMATVKLICILTHPHTHTPINYSINPSIALNQPTNWSAHLIIAFTSNPIYLTNLNHFHFMNPSNRSQSTHRTHS